MNIFINPVAGDANASKVINARRKAIAWMMLDDQLKEKWLSKKKKKQLVRKTPVTATSRGLSIIPAAERVNTAA